MKSNVGLLQTVVPFLVEASKQSRRNLAMPGNPHYQPKQLKPYLGYDQWACLCAVVEWVWLLSLAKCRVMPSSVAKLLTPELLRNIILKLTTTEMTAIERTKTNHDILALLELMRPLLPEALRRWLHLGLTSYDVICTAYAVQLSLVTRHAFMPLAREVDMFWRVHIRRYAETPRLGATHLQAAIGVTVGSWLGNLHYRYWSSARSAESLVQEVPGKFCGAVGNKAPVVVLFGSRKARLLEKTALNLLGLPDAVPCHQETPPEPTARFYGSLVTMSAALANLGEDIRHLQCTWIGEVITPSSRSSAMSHKGRNPVSAENDAGTYRSVVGEYVKLLLNQTTDLERDLRDSSVLRGYSAIMVFVTHQLNTVLRIFGKFEYLTKQAEENFRRFGKIVSAEALHLALQLEGEHDAHAFVNGVIVPNAQRRRQTIWVSAEQFAKHPKNEAFGTVWRTVLTRHTKLGGVLQHPDTYIGTSVSDARKAGRRVL